MKDSSLVSVVIPTYNSEKTLAKCLESIKNQTYKNTECIIVDNFSFDATQRIAKEQGVRVVESDAIRSKARNIGIKQSKGYFVLSIDSDMELTEGVVEECIKTFQLDEMVGGIIIPEKSIGSNFLVEIRDFERSFYAGTKIESARFFIKDLVEKVGGYEEDVVFYEESTLPQKIEKLGFNVGVRIKSEILHHENISVQRWLKKKYYYGKTAYEYKEKFNQYASRQISIFYRFSIFLRNKRFYSKPSLALGVLILKLLEYFAAGLGYMAGKKERDKIN
jgi:glycosyltransferase involved in cell wall biosynthesis